MDKPIQPLQKLLADYLKLSAKEVFVVPAYQRGYSWKKEQCDKLWDDIVAYRDGLEEEDVSVDDGGELKK